MTTGDERTALVREIRVGMLRAGIGSIEELARESGIAPGTLARRMAGGTGFTVDEVRRIAEALDVPVTTLLTDSTKAAS